MVAQAVERLALADVVALHQDALRALDERAALERRLEPLNLLGELTLKPFESPFAAARTCYDHIAGTLGVELHDRLVALEWIRATGRNRTDYDLTKAGIDALERAGVDVTAVQARRRRFAFACLDWSERRPHLGGALGAALLDLALARRWVEQDLDSRSLEVTLRGRREMRARFGLHSS